MKIKIKGEEVEYTLITIVSETVKQEGLMSKDMIKAVAFIYNSKNLEVKKVLADDITVVAR